MSETVAYSSLLQDFVEPIEIDNETEDAFYQKCLLGQLVWNFCTALDHDLDIIQDLAPAIDDAYTRGPELVEAIVLLMARKKQLFDEYDGFILKVDKRFSNGQPTIYCETIPADKMNEIYSRIKQKK